jgi:pimeloyl-ACP methyl ester carboxylesterase
MPLWKSGDIRLRFESCGQGDPLLLIHGLGSSSRDWENQARVFAEHYRVTIPDLRGHAMKEHYTAKLANGELKVIQGSGHFTPMDAPEKFNEAVLSFLALHA